jgi:glutathione S-transferase
MPMKLYAHQNNYKTQKALIAAKYAGLDIENPPAGSGDAAGKIPVLETDQGCIFTSIAIARYLSRIRRDVGLYGDNLIEGGMIDSWIEFCTHELEIPLCTWVFPLKGIFPEVPEATAQAKQDVRRALDVLNNHLLHNTYMVGNRVTLADICVCCALSDAMSLAFDAQFLEPLGNLMRWHTLIRSQPEVKAILGEVKLGDAKGGKAGSKAPPAGAKPKAEAAKSDKKAEAKKEPKKEAKPEKGGKADKGAAKAKPEAKAKAEPTPEEAKAAPEEARKKQMKKVMKEGGKRGVEIEGAADMGGLQFFCTSVDEPQGDMEMLNACMDAMNVESDPTEEERKGGSGRIGKMIFSAGTEHLGIVAYIPDALKDSIDAREWLKTVIDPEGGVVVAGGSGVRASATVKADAEKGKFPMKIKEPCITAAITFLKSKGLFPDKDDSDDEMVFGDDDFPS